MWLVFLCEGGLCGWCFCVKEGCVAGVSVCRRVLWLVFLCEGGLCGWCFCVREDCVSMWLLSRIHALP